MYFGYDAFCIYIDFLNNNNNNAHATYLWSQPIDSTTLELYFAIALKGLSGYSSTDLATFNIDDNFHISDYAILTLGDYTVVESDDELIIHVPVTIID